MTAIERIRELLDERGVEYRREGCEFFFGDYHIWAMSDSMLCMSRTNLTPEQAIDATLGSVIGGFWTADGTLHVTCGNLPERIEVTLPDERGREVHRAKVHEFERKAVAE